MAIQRLVRIGANGPEDFAPVDISTGAGDAGKVGVLDPTGRWDSSMMPVGIGADTAVIQASEALAAGDLVNIYDGGSGAFRCRKADGSAAGKAADGFVLVGVSSGANATVYLAGLNTQVTGLTPGNQRLSVTTPGKTQSTVTSTTGQVYQEVGRATAAGVLFFERGYPYTRA